MSPVSVSTSTLACSTAFGVFLYAESKASSSASTRASKAMPFSFSICRSASMISLLTVASVGVIVVDHVRLGDVGERQPDAAAVGEGQRDRGLAGRRQHAAEVAAPAPRLRQLDRHVAADDGGEVGRLAKAPVQAGRRDLERVALAHVVQRLADRRAQLEIDTAGLVDEQRQRAGGAAAHLEIDKLELGEALGQRGLDHRLKFLSDLPHERPLTRQKSVATDFSRKSPLVVCSLAERVYHRVG